MKANEVPQDESNLGSASLRELCYAVDENGNYTTVKSTGWTPKTIALDNAIEQINERVEEALDRFKKGQCSPLEYHMELNKMDLTILASYMGSWRWRVKRHFKPGVFARLRSSVKARYAEIFGISMEALVDPELRS